MTSVFRTEILSEGNVTKLSTEEMNYLEQKLTRSEEDQRIILARMDSSSKWRLFLWWDVLLLYFLLGDECL
jgi:hypothetical protein